MFTLGKITIFGFIQLSVCCVKPSYAFHNILCPYTWFLLFVEYINIKQRHIEHATKCGLINAILNIFNDFWYNRFRPNMCYSLETKKLWKHNKNPLFLSASVAGSIVLRIKHSDKEHNEKYIINDHVLIRLGPYSVKTLTLPLQFYRSTSSFTSTLHSHRHGGHRKNSIIF